MRSAVVLSCLLATDNGLQLAEAQVNGHSLTNGYDEAPASTSNHHPAVEVLCGPLLNYKGTSLFGEQIIWRGSVLIVTKAGARQPRLGLESLHSGDQVGQYWGQNWTFEGIKLYEDPTKGFWRFELQLPLGPSETRCRYTIRDMNVANEGAKNAWKAFVVPSATESMRIMFHSCNGFSVGTDEDAWSGPALWSDVMRLHGERPFHVMIGGGDQIYNDGVRVDGPLKQWAAIGNPKKRGDHPFDDKLRVECDKYYFQNYVRW